MCTEDICDAFETCQHIVLTGPCDDGNVCTTDDVCVDEDCIGSYGITGRACDWVALGRADNNRGEAADAFRRAGLRRCVRRPAGHFAANRSSPTTWWRWSLPARRACGSDRSARSAATS